ncbi:YuzB family protein [Bacillus sp. FJAT-27445]|uniref:YuzB family protein n=1 Tax=Bacillus sp. FJAT-27445 TaxID=1679166 RepID=UPI000743FB48|nr:YuzB family protein [Bacillus sp. FJAT-27445]
MGIVIVDICQSNSINVLDIETILESEYPEVSVLRNECLSFCGMCARSPFAIVNGKRVFAKTPEECLDKIRRQIEKELAFFE